ncbi:MAG: hypothetical protein PHE24_06000 [Patescibacteria group bacterium]|nr:hypothetical protein [Patescibacteria group bacterium]
MNLQNLKLALPKTWKEASRMGGENQVNIRVYHINPLAGIDPKNLQDQPMPSGDPKMNVYKVGIPTPGVRPINDFYKGMKGFIESGLAPADMNMGSLDKLWKGMTETPHAERPGESDMASDIDIVQCADEETARQILKNKALMPMQGFDVPIPGGITAPGLPKNMTMSDYLQSDVLKNALPKEQKEQLKKLQAALKEVKEKIPQVKQTFAQKGVKYGEGKYLGCEAVYMEFPNPDPPPQPKARVSSSKSFSGGGGYGYTGIDPLPKTTRPYSASKKTYLGILFKNFVIDGQLLSAIDSFPPGNTPCYSLSQTKKVTSTTKEGGTVFTDVAIVPLVSDYASEGYFHKEEAEKIYRDLISKLA